jgi:hypothetical protein
MKTGKNFFLSLAAAWLFSLATQAQVYENGKNYLNVGIGVGSFYRGLPFGFSYERGITDQISVGGFFDYASSSYSYFGYRTRVTFLYFGVRGSYHLNELLKVDNKQWDLYAGAALGYTGATVRYDDANLNSVADPYGSGVLFGIHAGARYMFTDNLGGFAELGYGVALLKLGLAVKF